MVEFGLEILCNFELFVIAGRSFDVFLHLFDLVLYGRCNFLLQGGKKFLEVRLAAVELFDSPLDQSILVS